MDFDSRQNSATYRGLLAQTYSALVLGGLCLLGVEILRRIPRRRGFDPSDSAQRAKVAQELRAARDTHLLTPADEAALERVGSREGWITG